MAEGPTGRDRAPHTEVVESGCSRRNDPDLETIRDRDWVRKLPKAEREACAALWKEYRTLLKELDK